MLKVFSGASLKKGKLGLLRARLSDEQLWLSSLCAVNSAQTSSFPYWAQLMRTSIQVEKKSKKMMEVVLSSSNFMHQSRSPNIASFCEYS